VTAIIQGANQSQFFYNGSGQMLRIVETSGGVIQADRRFVWCGMQMCEEWNSNNLVVNRYFDQGEQQGGTNLFYTRDQLGSIRELTDSTSAIRAEYAYAPYGSSAKLNGNLEANYGFNGHFRHLPSGLDLTPYRAYNSANGRWLSRDPAAENRGENLYAYAMNDPVNLVDTSGAKPKPQWGDALYDTEHGRVHVVTAAEFNHQVENMRTRISNFEHSYGQGALPVFALTADSMYFSDDLKGSWLCFRGQWVLGVELNYYFQGMIWREAGYSETTVHNIIASWKGVMYQVTPTANTYNMASAGWTEHQIVNPLPVIDYGEAYRAVILSDDY
jgi:RHS repeat-associated protein